jgi:hypothetical protein
VAAIETHLSPVSKILKRLSNASPSLAMLPATLPTQWLGCSVDARINSGFNIFFVTVFTPSNLRTRPGERAEGGRRNTAAQYHGYVDQPSREWPGRDVGRALAETLRLNTTLTLLYLTTMTCERALAETQRLCTPLTSLHLGENGLREGGGRALAEALASTPPLRSSTLATTRDTAAQQHPYGALRLLH